MRKILKIVEYNRATKWQRFANLFIDKLVINLFIIIIGFVGVFIDNVIGSNIFTTVLLKLSEMGRLADIILTSFLYFLYTFLMEYFTNGKTIGKYITGTKVIMTDGQLPTFENYFLRNISRLVPFDGLSFLGENGWHDSWSDTRVINTKNYETERQAKSEIESIGAKEIA
ncbi:putative RDD family membrane protein YckC [Chryseobacterium ginsenosidimutans]|uniref:RDD family protein n=1 Tax=Chryseobacterium ginsenosidimutans TaxID=687846 RepID=UPI002167EE13|nr:RDD family protein [Chryseobacterium ginsenosidimutans]MCS3871308.1 putative RDD family membrane protein YckC [Chryseobacterium ginsenosidimutans]